MTLRILRLNEVKEFTGLSRSSIYLKMTKGQFPQKVQLAGRAVGWIDEEISEWIIQQARRRAQCDCWIGSTPK